MPFVMGERPNEARQELIRLRGRLEGLRGMVETAFDGVRVPLDVAWQGDTPARVEFAGRLESYRQAYSATYQESLDALAQAIWQEPETVPGEVWEDDPPLDHNKW